jgi:hypothetical protein
VNRRKLWRATALCDGNCKVSDVSGIQVIFYSMYGHIYQLAEAVTAGTREAGA